MHRPEDELAIPTRTVLQRLLSWGKKRKPEQDVPPAPATVRRPAVCTVRELAPPAIQLNESQFSFRAEHLDSAAVFSASIRGSHVELQLNSAHPVFPLLASCIEGAASFSELDALRAENQQLREGIRALLAGWAVYEHDLHGPRRHRAEDARYDWGRGIRRLLLRD